MKEKEAEDEEMGKGKERRTGKERRVEYEGVRHCHSKGKER